MLSNESTVEAALCDFSPDINRMITITVEFHLIALMKCDHIKRLSRCSENTILCRTRHKSGHNAHSTYDAELVVKGKTIFNISLTSSKDNLK